MKNNKSNSMNNSVSLSLVQGLRTVTFMIATYLSQLMHLLHLCTVGSYMSIREVQSLHCVHITRDSHVECYNWIEAQVYILNMMTKNNNSILFQTTLTNIIYTIMGQILCRSLNTWFQISYQKLSAVPGSGLHIIIQKC